MVELTPHIILLALLSGAIVGLFLGTFGGGGSVLAAPLLLYVVGVEDPHVAIGTSAAAVAAIALVSLFGHWRGGRVKWPCATVFATSGLIGSILGSSLAKITQGDWLLLGFAIAMAMIALSMFRTPKTAGDPDVTLTPSMVMQLAPIGLVVGTAAGFFGIGGGFLIVPGLMLAVGMTMTNAAASSLVSVALFGAATSANYAVSGLVDGRLILLLLGGGALGGLFGIVLSKWLASRLKIARTAFALMILVVALFVAMQAGQSVFRLERTNLGAGEELELFLNLDWPTFLFAMLLIELTPGPNMGWLTLLSAQHGARVGLTAVLGIALGLAVQVMVAATGLSALMAGYPILYEALRWGGVLFMIWLAWQAIVENGSATPAIGLQEKGFRRGFIANLLNPKALVFYAVVIGQFTDPALGSVWWQILTLGILHIGIATLVHLALVLLGTRIGDGIETWRTSYTARIFFSVSLFAVAIWIAVSTA